MSAEAHVKRTQSGEASKRNTGDSSWNWGRNSPRGKGGRAVQAEEEAQGGHKVWDLDRDVIPCLEHSTVTWLRMVGEEAERPCCPPKCHWSRCLEQEADNEVVLDALHLSFRIHPALTSVCSRPRDWLAVDHIHGLPCPPASSRLWPRDTGKKSKGRRLRLGYVFPWWKIPAPVG